MSDIDPREELLWEVGWLGHETAQRRRLAALSLTEKLRWLEEAQQVVTQLKAGRRADDEKRSG